MDAAPRTLAPLAEVSLAEQARESIRTAILDGSLAPEQRLTIEQLAAQLGVSRTPVREALKALENDGLVRLRPHHGAVVEPMAREELQHRYAVRAMLEGYAAMLACEHDAQRTGRDLDANCARASKIARTGPAGEETTRRLADLNQEFHRIIRDASHSKTLVRLLESLRNPLAFTLAYWREPASRLASLEIHEQIADAFLARDPVLARTLTERHLLAASDRLLEPADD